MMRRPYAAEIPRQVPISAANATFPSKIPTDLTQSRAMPSPRYHTGREKSSESAQRCTIWVRSVKLVPRALTGCDRAQERTTLGTPIGIQLQKRPLHKTRQECTKMHKLP